MPSITFRRLSFKLFARFLRPGDLIHQRIAHSAAILLPAFSSARHDAWHTRLTDELLRLYYIYKAHRGSDDKIRMDLPLLHHLIQSNKGRRRVADGKMTGPASVAARSILTIALVTPRSFASAATSGSAIKQRTRSV